MDFFGILDWMGTAFQEKTMTISYLKEVAFNCIKTLQQLRTNSYTGMIFNLALHY